MDSETESNNIFSAKLKIVPYKWFTFQSEGPIKHTLLIIDKMINLFMVRILLFICITFHIVAAPDGLPVLQLQRDFLHIDAATGGYPAH